MTITGRATFKDNVTKDKWLVVLANGMDDICSTKRTACDKRWCPRFDQCLRWFEVDALRYMNRGSRKKMKEEEYFKNRKEFEEISGGQPC